MLKKLIVPDSDKQWHVWTVNPNKFQVVSMFIEKEVTEVKEVLYPTVTSERKTSKGKIKTKKVPLYQGYLFLQYSEDPIVWHKLNSHPFITNYVGRCTQQDLFSVYNLKNVEHLNKEENKVCEVGDFVKIQAGPMKGFSGKVTLVRSDYIKISIEVFGRSGVPAVVNPADIDIISRET